METIKAKISATIIESHIPFSPTSTGRIKIDADWNTRVRKKDMIAEMMPLLSAVKKPDPHIAIPEKRNENEKI